MKRVITIKIQTDMNHPSKEEWAKKEHFLLDEIDKVLDEIRGSHGRKYRNCSGKTESNATNYTVSIRKMTYK